MKTFFAAAFAAALAVPAWAGTITYDIDQNFSGSNTTHGLGPSATGPRLHGTVTFDDATLAIVGYDLFSQVMPYGIGNLTRQNTHYTDANSAVVKTPVSAGRVNYLFTQTWGPDVTAGGDTMPQYRAQLNLTFDGLDDLGSPLTFDQSESVAEFVENYCGVCWPEYRGVYDNFAQNANTIGSAPGATVSNTPAVPLPAGLPLMLGALTLAGVVARRKAA